MARKSVHKVARKSVHEHFARLPDSVLLSHELTPAARCVYGFIAGCIHHGTVANVGQRWIAKKLGFSRSTVLLALEQLEAKGHVKAVASGRARGMYHLTSDVFMWQQRALDTGETITETIVSYPRRRLATVRKSA